MKTIVALSALLSILCLSTLAHTGEVYFWKTPDGSVCISDKPPREGEKTASAVTVNVYEHKRASGSNADDSSRGADQTAAADRTEGGLAGGDKDGMVQKLQDAVKAMQGGSEKEEQEVMKMFQQVGK